MSQKEEIDEPKVIAGVYEQMMGASITSYNILTKKDLERHFIELSERDRGKNTNQVWLGKDFLSLLTDKDFLSVVESCTVMCSSKTLDYILERYNKLKQQDNGKE